MVIRNNPMGLTAWRNAKNTGLKQRRSAARLASGNRINSAADDAAELAISENMYAQIRGLNQGGGAYDCGVSRVLLMIVLQEAQYSYRFYFRTRNFINKPTEN